MLLAVVAVVALPVNVPVRFPVTVNAATVNLVPSNVIFDEPVRVPFELNCTCVLEPPTEATDIDPPRDTEVPFIVIDELTNLLLAIEPANISLVTTPDPIAVVKETLPEPLNDTAVAVTFPVNENVLVFCNVVAVEALPFNVAVIVPAEKLPEASLATIAFIVFADVAVVAELGIEFREAPEPENVVAVIVPAEKLPDPSLRTIWLATLEELAVIVAELA